jgi:hypothetical protein
MAEPARTDRPDPAQPVKPINQAPAVHDERYPRLLACPAGGQRPGHQRAGAHQLGRRGCALRSLAPQVRLFVANVTDGSCRPVHSIDPDTPASIGSVFKLYVLHAGWRGTGCDRAVPPPRRGRRRPGRPGAPRTRGCPVPTRADRAAAPDVRRSDPAGRPARTDAPRHPSAPPRPTAASPWWSWPPTPNSPTCPNSAATTKPHAAPLASYPPPAALTSHASLPTSPTLQPQQPNSCPRSPTPGRTPDAFRVWRAGHPGVSNQTV